MEISAKFRIKVSLVENTIIFTTLKNVLEDGLECDRWYKFIRNTYDKKVADKYLENARDMYYEYYNEIDKVLESLD